jgi:transposase-like protein
MSKSYSPEYKQMACQLLQTNGGNVDLTSRQTGIPPRTLREWRQRHAHQPPQQDTRRRQNVEEQLHFLRERMMEQAIALAMTLSSETDPSLLSQRIIALTRLVDRLMKLDIAVPAEVVVRVVRTDRDGNEIVYPSKEKRATSE